MKRLLPLLVIVALSTHAASLSFNVQIGTEAKMDAYHLQYRNSTETVQNLNMTVENTGSVGCDYRIRADFRYKNLTKTRYSKGYSLWPGATTTAKLLFIPENHTGEVNASVYSMFCDQKKFVDNVSFESREKNLVNRSFNSTTVEVSETGARIEMNVDNATLLPRETPPYWKASHSQLVNGTAELEYDPPIFSDEEELEYTLVKNNSIVGSTTVSLEEKKTYLDRLSQRSTEILALLLFYVSVLASKLLLDRYLLREN